MRASIKSITRRQFIAKTTLGAAALGMMPQWLHAMEGMSMVDFPRLAARKANPDFKPDVEIEIVCKRGQIGILPNQLTQVYQYVGRLITGPERTVSHLPLSYLGPLLRLHLGQKVRIHLRNELGEPTITHWHGLHVPAEMDGHPMYVFDSGETFVYEFEINNRAGLFFYHPHTHGRTGFQVYQGLAGAMLINDEEELKLELPSGEFELPVVIQDRRFDANSQLSYVNGMHERMVGFHGDQILVNGRPDYTVDVASRAYRLRVVNGSNARIYKLAWDDGTPVTVLGVDGGLLEKPEHRPYVMLAPGERLDVWADFSGRSIGSELVLRSRPYTGLLPKMAEQMMQGQHQGGIMESMRGMMGHEMKGMHGMMHHGSQHMLPGSDFPIMTLRVTRKTSDSPTLPIHLSTIKRYEMADVSNPEHPVPIAISESHMAMLLNGRAYAFNDFLPSERIPVNTLQLMEIFHAHEGHGMGGMGGMMTMAHPIHLHEQPFQILSRTIGADGAEAYASCHEGLIDSGWKDTVLVLPGEKVKIIKPFNDYKGRYMMHCHNLEHEDMGMMRDLLVE